MQNVFLIGSRGIPLNYGGYETFVQKLTEYHQNDKKIQYYVACQNFDKEEFIFQNARCFNVQVPNIGPAKAVLYDYLAVKKALKYIQENHLKNAIIYICTCRIGLFIRHLKHKMKILSCTYMLNPDGHEWKRAKWNWAIRKYWKFSEARMVKYADTIVCDSFEIEKYILSEYPRTKERTTVIAYGADLRAPLPLGQSTDDWFAKFQIVPGQYYISVGRFVPENNLEIMLREFCTSDSQKDFVVVTDYEDNKFYKHLQKTTGFQKDPRVKFVGPVYDRELLKHIRRNAFAYFHGHEVGGTNPSLLEAMADSCFVLAIDVSFSREVLANNGFFFRKDVGSLHKIIAQCEQLPKDQYEQICRKNRSRLEEYYSWPRIAQQYKDLFEQVK